MKATLIAAATSLTLALPAAAADPDPADWDAVVEAAQGQTVYWNAWGGSDVVNDYIAWVGEQAAEQRVTLEHVKLTDTAEAVSRVLAEKTAGRDDDGGIDLVWINGENFAAMKERELLFEHYWVQSLSCAQLLLILHFPVCERALASTFVFLAVFFYRRC